MPSTYTAINTTTLTSATASITFSSIPSTYTDLVLVVTGKIASGGNNLGLDFRVNGDTGTNYSITQLLGDSSSAIGGQEANSSRMNLGIITQDYESSNIINIMNYANTTTYKSFLSRGNSSGSYVRLAAGSWRSTAAINSVTVLQITGVNLAIGTTATLYGIKAA